jgi:hypothetical protein
MSNLTSIIRDKVNSLEVVATTYGISISDVTYISPGVNVGQFKYVVDDTSKNAYSTYGVTGIFNGDFDPATGVDTGLSKALAKVSNTSPVASSSMQSGTLTIEEFTVAKGAGTFLYTGNGIGQAIVTDIPSIDFTSSLNGSGFWFDRSVNQVKDDAGVIHINGECLANISNVHIKARSTTGSNFKFDGLRGVGRYILTDTAGAEAVNSTYIQSFNIDGFTIGTSQNANATTYVVHQELYTHVKWGTTSSGKLYLEAYNPVTLSNMILFIGDGSTGYQVPHSLRKPLDLMTFKVLNSANNWLVSTDVSGDLFLNTPGAQENDKRITDNTEEYIEISNTTHANILNQATILYGKVKSKIWTLIQYSGTGTADNFIETRDSEGNTRKPSRVIIKPISTTGGWWVSDNKRGSTSYLYLSLSQAEAVNPFATFEDGGFNIVSNYSGYNSSGVQYIALVEFDTNADGGDSYFDLPTDDTNLNLTDAVLTYTDGKDQQGFLLSTRNIVSESIEFSTAPDGFVYVYRDLSGEYGFDIVEPKFDTTTGYYSGEVTAKSYIAKVMVASGTPQYVDGSWTNYRVTLPSTRFGGQASLDSNVKIVDFGSVFLGKRYVADNPFGNESYKGCVVRAEIFFNDTWGDPGFMYSSGAAGGYGVKGNATEDGLVVQVGNSATVTLPTYTGNPFQLTASYTQAVPCRVIVTYIGETQND